ncbi:NmrA family NAD(P)-binding protein [Spongiactinospora gelatinilytica]|uniref:NmrA family NAD(P)-binding protein n=1 Tax=Spongiactinospora gelatinilytica TaxID=2666298 RepID=UPI0018F5EC94|nr:NmrA family NAD(P)-binding protein [Spongiactinospora gelatinilytica]
MRTVAELEERLARPSAGLIEDMGGLDGDPMILGAGAKLGPSLVRLALNAVRGERRVIAVSRFSEPGLADSLREAGATVVPADVADEPALAALPDAANVAFLILADLITPHRVVVDGREVEVEFVGGLLGQWAVWVRRAVELLDEARGARAGDDGAVRRLLTLDGHLTDANAAIFDVVHGFHGCIPGIHEVLRRQGLRAGRWCLDPAEDLSPGQLAEIDRIWAAYPWLRDDDFVAEGPSRWLS